LYEHIIMAQESQSYDDEIRNQMLYDHDRSIDEILESADKRRADNTNQTTEWQAGIDEEVKVNKAAKAARKPIPKLDEARQVYSVLHVTVELLLTIELRQQASVVSRHP
jgi:hypothetical protein